MKKTWSKAAGLLISALFALGLLLLPNLFLQPFPLNINDKYLAWIVSPGRFFVETPGGLLRTNPDLVGLDNGEDSFSKVKAPGVFRIFCVGGSTTRGWPFQHSLSYPLLMSRYLASALPGRKVEVINAGFLASDSYSDLPLVRELAAYSPDLLLVYEGRNDAWNFTLHSGLLCVALKAHVWLARNLRLYGLLLKLVPRGGAFEHAGQIRKLAFAASGVRNEYGGAFKENIEKIGVAAGKCPVLFLTQVIYPGVPGFEQEAVRSNGHLRELAAEKKIKLLDIDKVFAGFPQPLDVLIPPPLVHPNVGGYCLLAYTVSGSLKREGLIFPARDWRKLEPWPVCRDSVSSSRAALGDTLLRLADLFGQFGDASAAARYRAEAENQTLYSPFSRVRLPF
ncbi:MAG: hypothetical protein A2234_00180 [Elusimicrobia bacterium RIFOXYA2_FULL_58_8]|nr:MAG: hypothetical protein A2234_00180 [Elusimicrobia bacterium RIFOXYA2_FULL_58_8]